MQKVASAADAFPASSYVEQEHTFGATRLFPGQSVGYIQVYPYVVLPSTYEACFDRSCGYWLVWCRDAFGRSRLCLDPSTELPVVFLTDEDVFQFCCVCHVQSEGLCGLRNER